MKPLVSVIIVSFNTRTYTTTCIEHVIASKGLSAGAIEIIVVDNNSSDDTVRYVKKNFPQVICITNKTNHGFGGGNNQAIAKARGEYILLLNTDAFLEKNSLQILVDTLKKHSDISSVGPQYRYATGALQMSAGYFPSLLRVVAWMWWLDKIPFIKNLFSKPYHISDLTWYKKPQYPDWLMGACILLRKSELQSTGGFDEAIFMYGEEVELYYRLHRETGKKSCFTPDTWITHLGSASTQKASASRLLLELDGIAYFYKKHAPSMLGFIRFVIYTGVIIRILIFGLTGTHKEARREYKKYIQAI